jgi:hypothetical protein
MGKYLVTWSIDIEAESAAKAAAEAQKIQKDPESIATVFLVTNQHNGKIYKVDVKEKEKS